MPTQSAPLPVDPALAVLVRLAEEDDFFTAVTIVVPGAVVSGSITGRSTWIKNLLSDADTGEDSGGDRRALIEALHKEEFDGDPDQPVAYQLIHLEHATIRSGATAYGDGQLRWRGRLDQVVGWHVGEL